MGKLLRMLPRALRDRLIVSRLRIDEAELDGLMVKVATTVDEHEQASRLVHTSYLRRGIIHEQSSGVWITAHGLLPSTVVFVAKFGAQVVGTLSLIVDSNVGLPMDKICAKELAPLRGLGRRIAEVGALCIEEHRRGLGIALLLNKIMFRCAHELLGVQDLVIAVHPDAACQYEAVLRFVSLGGVRSYPGLTRTALAVPLRLDLERAEEVLARVFGKLGADPRSPYYIYFIRQDPQIVLPTLQALREGLSAVRARSAERLAALRPDCFEELSTMQRRLLRPVFPSFTSELRSFVSLEAAS